MLLRRGGIELTLTNAKDIKWHKAHGWKEVTEAQLEAEANERKEKDLDESGNRLAYLQFKKETEIIK